MGVLHTDTSSCIIHPLLQETKKPSKPPDMIPPVCPVLDPETSLRFFTLSLSLSRSTYIYIYVYIVTRRPSIHLFYILLHTLSLQTQSSCQIVLEPKTPDDKIGGHVILLTDGVVQGDGF